MGTGPFGLVSWKPGRIVLEAFQDYWGGAPRLSHVVFRRFTDERTLARALLSGEVDVSSAIDQGRVDAVLASTLVLACVVVFWQPLGGVLWQVTDPLAVGALYGLFAVGWGILFLASFQINHFDLFGLRQTWRYARGQGFKRLEIGRATCRERV